MQRAQIESQFRWSRRSTEQEQMYKNKQAPTPAWPFLAAFSRKTLLSHVEGGVAHQQLNSLKNSHGTFLAKLGLATLSLPNLPNRVAVIFF